MAEHSPDTPQVKNIWPDFGGYVDDWSREAYSAGIRQERARCAAIARAKKEGRFAHGISDAVWKGACDLIAEAIERGES